MAEVNSTATSARTIVDDLRAFAHEAVARHRGHADPLVRSITELAVLAMLDAAHVLAADIATTQTVSEALVIRRRVAAVRVRVAQLEDLAFARADELSGGK